MSNSLTQTYRRLRDRWSFDPLAAQITTMAVAAAMVIPILGLTIYGFSTGWDLLGGATLAIMCLVGIVYYLILWSLMKRRKGETPGDAAGG